MSTTFDTIVVGAGQAGLAAGYYLRHAGLAFTILEASAQPAGSWPNYYDNLKLFTPARYAALPGLPFPGAPDRYPLRDEVVAYLRDYAAHFGLPVVTGARVEHVQRSGLWFHLLTAAGDLFQARGLIAATGSFHRPYLPHFPGQAAFRGRILHAAAYRNPEPFRDRRVVVVGAGNSAVQIGVEIARVARVTLATRAPVKFIRQRLLGRDIHFWVRLTGLDMFPFGSWTGLREARPVLDTGDYRATIQAGKPERRPVFTAFTPAGVIWPGGSREQVDVVIFATGYRPNLDYLAGRDALDAGSGARHRAGVSLTTPGLYYVGLAAQRTLVLATLRGVGPDAAYVVNHLLRYLRQP